MASRHSDVPMFPREEVVENMFGIFKSLFRILVTLEGISKPLSIGTKKLEQKNFIFLRNNPLAQLFHSYLLPLKECHLKHLKILNSLTDPKGMPYVYNLK